MNRSILYLLFVSMCLAFPLKSAAEEKKVEQPVITSIFPLVLKQGTDLEAQIQGRHLGGSYAVWFDCDSLEGEILAVEQSKAEDASDSKNEPAEYRISVRLKAGQKSEVGLHTFRLVSKQGASNALTVAVSGESVIREIELSSERDDGPLILQSLPAIVSGNLGSKGELDLYTFKAEAGQSLSFEVFPGNRSFDPQLVLFEPRQGWFKRNQLERLAFRDDPNTALDQLNPRLDYRFTRSGDYVLSVGAFLGRGGSDCSYILQIVSCDSHPKQKLAEAAHVGAGRWNERDFLRALTPDRIRVVSSRSVDGNDEAVAKASEREPNDSPENSLTIQIPALIEGTIDHAGDLDWFKLAIPDRTPLAVEIQTTGVEAPYFIPLVQVIDSDGEEIIENVYPFVQGSGEFIEKVLEPKVIYTFERGGDYLLKVQEVTARNGGLEHSYRVLIRPQIPHMGRIEIGLGITRSFEGTIRKSGTVDRVNLTPGEALKLAVVTEHEEGFEGQVIIRVENLPPGVQALPATEVKAEMPGPLDEGPKERFRPGTEAVTLMLVAGMDAPYSSLPQMAQILAQPVVNGRLGSAVLVEEIPVMVIQGETESEISLRPERYE